MQTFIVSIETSRLSASTDFHSVNRDFQVRYQYKLSVSKDFKDFQTFKNKRLLEKFWSSY